MTTGERRTLQKNNDSKKVGKYPSPYIAIEKRHLKFCCFLLMSEWRILTLYILNKKFNIFICVLNSKVI